MLVSPFAEPCLCVGCYVSTGGFIERVLSASLGNKSVISKYLTACKNLGYAFIAFTVIILRPIRADTGPTAGAVECEI